MIKKIFTVIALLAIAELYPQQFLSLEDAVKLALQNNYSITIAREEQKIFENNTSLGNAGFLPEVNGNASYIKEVESSDQEFFNGTTTNTRNGSSTTLNAGIALNWTLFDGMRMFVNLDRYKKLQEINQIEFKGSVEDLIYEVYNIYYSLVKEQRVLKVMSKNLALSEERMNIVQAEKDLGSASKFDLLQANVDYNEDKSNYLREELRIQQLFNNFAALLNVEQKEYQIADSIPQPDLLVFEEIQKLALENNTDLRLINQRRNLIGLDLQLAQSEWFPNISFGAGYNFLKSDNDAGTIRSNEAYGFNYGLRASINIFDGFNTQRQIENAIINKNIAELEIKNLEQRVNTELNNTYKRYVNANALVKLERDNLSAASQNSDIAIERLRLGEISALEFRNIQRNLLDAESRYYTALFDLKLSEIDLLRIAGKLIQL